MFNQLVLWIYEKTPAYWEIVGFFALIVFIGFLVGVN